MNERDYDRASSARLGWSTAVLREITSIITSGSRGWGAYYSHKGPRFIRVGDFIRGSIALSLEGMAHVAPPDNAEGLRTSVRPGDLLLTITADVGMVAVAPAELGTAYVNQHVALIRPLNDLDPRCLAYGLLDPVGFQRIVRASQYGATKAGLSLEQVRTFEVKVPPKGEQSRIVEALDTYVSRLDAAADGLKRVETNLKRYRASVLKAAVEGRLVPTEAELAKKEGRSYEPATVLLDRILKDRRRRWEESELAKMNAKGETPSSDKWKSRYEEPALADESKLTELPKGWRWTTLDSLLGEPLRNGHSARAASGEVGIRTLTLTAVTEGDFSEANTKLTIADENFVRDLWLQPGDLLIQRSNTRELVGTARMYRGPREFAIFPDLLIRIRIPDLRLAEYVEICLAAPDLRLFFQKRAQGIAGSMPKISQGIVGEAPIPLPPRDEMLRIVAECQRLISLQAVTTHAAGTECGRIARLRQSILKWAFEGKLVDQDPNDEPASELLARIKAEREKAAPAATTGRRAPRPKAKRAVVA